MPKEDPRSHRRGPAGPRSSLLAQEASPRSTDEATDELEINPGGTQEEPKMPKRVPGGPERGQRRP